MRLLLLLLVGGGLGCGLFSDAEEPTQSLEAWQGAAQRVDREGGMVAALTVSPGWSFTGAYAACDTYSEATLLPSGKVLVTGGSSCDSSTSEFRSAEVYAPATGAWSPTGFMTTGRFIHTATLLPSGKVLVAGGRGLCTPGCSVLRSAEVYDPATGEWSPTGSLVRARARHTATLLPSGNVLVSGGNYRRAEVYSTLIVVDPAYDSATSDITPTYSGTAEADSTVTLIVDDSPVGNTLADAAGQWNFSPTMVLAEGPHMVRATAQDAAGNITAHSSPNAFRVDTAPPPAPLLVEPANGLLIVDNMPIYSGTAEADSTVTLIVDDLSVGNAMADAAGEWSFTPTTALAEGAHTVWAVAKDEAGNAAPASAARGFTVDTVPPGAPEMSLPDVFNTQKPIIAGMAEPLGAITIWLDGTGIGTIVAPETGLWVFTPDKEVAEGDHLIKATARDAAGNVSPDSVEHRFKIVIVQRRHYGWNCATAPAFPATWALLTLSLALRGRRLRSP